MGGYAARLNFQARLRRGGRSLNSAATRVDQHYDVGESAHVAG